MKYKLTNISGFPLDISTLSGPEVLPAYGDMTADLGALDYEVMAQSPYVTIDAVKPKKDK